MHLFIRMLAKLFSGSLQAWAAVACPSLTALTTLCDSPWSFRSLNCRSLPPFWSSAFAPHSKAIRFKIKINIMTLCVVLRILVREPAPDEWSFISSLQTGNFPNAPALPVTLQVESLESGAMTGPRDRVLVRTLLSPWVWVSVSPPVQWSWGRRN